MEFCEKKQDLSCSEDYTFKMFCSDTNFSDGCTYNEYDPDYRCTNKLSFSKVFKEEQSGPYSRCFNIESDGDKLAGCFTSKC